MEDFRWTYLQLCKEGGVEPQEGVVAQLQESRAAHSSRLDLSGHSLSTDTCSVLARAFQKDAVFTEVSLSDCMLTEEGVYDCQPCWLYDAIKQRCYTPVLKTQVGPCLFWMFLWSNTIIS